MGWRSVTHVGVGFRASTQPTATLYLILLTYLVSRFLLFLSGFSSYSFDALIKGESRDRSSSQNIHRSHVNKFTFVVADYSQLG
jgi:hypothetical protein